MLLHEENSKWRPASFSVLPGMQQEENTHENSLIDIFFYEVVFVKKGLHDEMDW